MGIFQEKVSLKSYSNYKIGGPARYFFNAKNEKGLLKALAEAKKLKLKIFFLGGGTNLLIADEGFNGLVIKCAFHEIKRSGNSIQVGAGVTMAKLVRFAAKENLSGLEWAGGLPGTVGGAVRGNAGCFGSETKDSIKKVRSVNIKNLNAIERNNSSCAFGYRSSVYKEKNGEEVIVSATFSLKKGKKKDIWQATKKNIDWRKERHPMEYPNIGSIFKNVPLKNIPKRWLKELGQDPKMDPFPVIPAARLIARAKLKGKRHGGAMISDKHTNFIVNTKNAKAADVIYLIRFIQRTIKNKFGIKIEPEVQILF